MVVLLLAPFERLERDDDLAAGAGALTLPRLGGTVERVALDRQLDTPSRHVLEQLELGASPILGGEQEVRVAHDRQLLAAHVRGAERRLRPGRLPDVHDARVWSGVGERVRERLTPHGVDADGEAVVLELLRDATELAASHGEDKVGSEQLRRLRRYAPHGAGPAEHEDAIARPHLRLPRDRHPAGDAGDAGSHTECGVGSGRQLRLQLRRRVHALGEEARLAGSSRLAEEVEERAVVTAGDRLGAGDVRQVGMATVEHAAADRDVERIERDRLDAEAVDVGKLDDLGRRAELDDLCSAHQATSSSRPTAASAAPRWGNSSTRATRPSCVVTTAA